MFVFVFTPDSKFASRTKNVRLLREMSLGFSDAWLRCRMLRIILIASQVVCALSSVSMFGNFG